MMERYVARRAGHRLGVFLGSPALPLVVPAIVDFVPMLLRFRPRPNSE
jgi:hypothetical protein